MTGAVLRDLLCATVLMLGVCASAQAAPPASATIVGNIGRGAALYPERCGGCHSLEVNRVGPAHRGVVGRRAGTALGFAYSPALKRANLTFTEANIDRWLINPQASVPGTRMYFRLGAAGERADIIAYLKSQPAAR
jgi:cytochrome c